MGSESAANDVDFDAAGEDMADALMTEEDEASLDGTGGVLDDNIFSDVSEHPANSSARDRMQPARKIEPLRFVPVTKKPLLIINTPFI
ncbi:hypothetical protein NSA36_01255 [Anaerotruncus colihominis]|nr:hypothetical protein [Anaerotruncus colihominis]